MARLLYIKASPRGERSYSTAVADAFVEAYKSAHPEDEVITLDLFKLDLPAFDGHVIDSKYVILHGLEHTQEQLDAWKAVEDIIEEFKSADKYVFAVPMWNFGIPYRLKHYIDVITQPGYTFAVSEEGYSGLVTGKQVFIAYARGGQYPPGTDFEAWNMQSPYFEFILGFMGLTDFKRLVCEPTLMAGPDAAKQKRDELKKEAVKMAKDF
ncbi:FMN-dependent NADH-azoreductase [Thermodesulfobacteriota bacterium]